MTGPPVPGSISIWTGAIKAVSGRNRPVKITPSHSISLRPEAAVDLDAAHAVAADDARRGACRSAPARRSRGARSTCRGARAVMRAFSSMIASGFDAGVAQGQQGREGDQLAADDDRPLERTLAVEIDELLQGAGVHHAERTRCPRPGGRCAASRARRLRAARRPWPGESSGPLGPVTRTRPPGSSLQAVMRSLRSAPDGFVGQALGIVGAGIEPCRTRAGRSRGGRNGAGCRPASLSRSSTTTSWTPRLAQVARAAERPAGPPPRIRHVAWLAFGHGSAAGLRPSPAPARCNRSPGSGPSCSACGASVRRDRRRAAGRRARPRSRRASPARNGRRSRRRRRSCYWRGRSSARLGTGVQIGSASRMSPKCLGEAAADICAMPSAPVRPVERMPAAVIQRRSRLTRDLIVLELGRRAAGRHRSRSPNGARARASSRRPWRSAAPASRGRPRRGRDPSGPPPSGRPAGCRRRCGRRRRPWCARSAPAG